MTMGGKKGLVDECLPVFFTLYTYIVRVTGMCG